MPANRFGVQTVGTEAAPLVLGAGGSPTDVATWVHNRGFKASKVTLLNAVNRDFIPRLSATLVAVPSPPGARLGLVVTQPNANTLVITNTDTAPSEPFVAEIQWETHTIDTLVALPAGTFILT
jgi:hypothetical protein